MPFLLQSRICGYGFAEIFRQILRICLKISASPRSHLRDFATKAHSATVPCVEACESHQKTTPIFIGVV